MTMTDRLRTAADYMQAHGWVQGTEQDDAGHVCLTGAIRYCAPVDGDTHLIREVLRKRDRAESWNDTRGRGEDEVLTLLRTLDITDDDLADTFGPEWVAIVALVRRAASLTAAEGKQLDAARDAAWTAARDAARDAARVAARVAAWTAARDAARGAARAIVVRDLIGQHGFTQAHYDVLTKVWRTTIGPLHPDDTEMSV